MKVCATPEGPRRSKTKLIKNHMFFSVTHLENYGIVMMNDKAMSGG